MLERVLHALRMLQAKAVAVIGRGNGGSTWLGREVVPVFSWGGGERWLDESGEDVFVKNHVVVLV